MAKKQTTTLPVTPTTRTPFALPPRAEHKPVKVQDHSELLTVIQPYLPFGAAVGLFEFYLEAIEGQIHRDVIAIDRAIEQKKPGLDARRGEMAIENLLGVLDFISKARGFGADVNPVVRCALYLSLLDQLHGLYICGFGFVDGVMNAINNYDNEGEQPWSDWFEAKWNSWWRYSDYDNPLSEAASQSIFVQ